MMIKFKSQPQDVRGGPLSPRRFSCLPRGRGRAGAAALFLLRQALEGHSSLILKRKQLQRAHRSEQDQPRAQQQVGDVEGPKEGKKSFLQQGDHGRQRRNFSGRITVASGTGMRLKPSVGRNAAKSVASSFIAPALDQLERAIPALGAERRAREQGREKVEELDAHTSGTPKPSDVEKDEKCVVTACKEFDHGIDKSHWDADCCAMPADARCAAGTTYRQGAQGCGNFNLKEGQRSTCCENNQKKDPNKSRLPDANEKRCTAVLGWSPEARYVLCRPEFEREGWWSLPVLPDGLYTAIPNEPRHYVQTTSPALLRNNGLDLNPPAYAQHVKLGSSRQADALLLHARGVMCFATSDMVARSDGHAGGTAIPTQGTPLKDAYCFQDEGSSHTGLHGLWQHAVADSMRGADFGSLGTGFSTDKPHGWDSSSMNYRSGDTIFYGLSDGRNGQGIFGPPGNFGILMYHEWLFPTSLAGRFTSAARQLLPRLPQDAKPTDVLGWLKVVALAKHLGVQPDGSDAFATPHEEVQVNGEKVKPILDAVVNATRAKLRAAEPGDGVTSQSQTTSTKRKIMVRARTGDVIDGQATPLDIMMKYPTLFSGAGNDVNYRLEPLLAHEARAAAVLAYFKSNGWRDQVEKVDIVTYVRAGGDTFLQGHKSRCPKSQDFVDILAKIWRKAFPNARVTFDLGWGVGQREPRAAAVNKGKTQTQSHIDAARKLAAGADSDVVSALHGYDAIILDVGGFNNLIWNFGHALQVPGIVSYWAGLNPFDEPRLKAADVIQRIRSNFNAHCGPLRQFLRKAVAQRNAADSRCTTESEKGNPVHCNQDFLDKENAPLYDTARQIARENRDSVLDGHPLLKPLGQAAADDDESYAAALRNVLRGLGACTAWVARNTAKAQLGIEAQQVQEVFPAGVQLSDLRSWGHFISREYEASSLDHGRPFREDLARLKHFASRQKAAKPSPADAAADDTTTKPEEPASVAPSPPPKSGGSAHCCSGSNPAPPSPAPADPAPEAPATTPEEAKETPEEAKQTPEEAKQTPEEAKQTPEEAKQTPEEAKQTPEEAKQTPEEAKETGKDAEPKGAEKTGKEAEQEDFFIFNDKGEKKYSKAGLKAIGAKITKADDRNALDGLDGHCSNTWCSSVDSPDDPGLDCWAGSVSEACTCLQGLAVQLGGTVMYQGQKFYHYRCCIKPSGYSGNAKFVGKKCGNYVRGSSGVDDVQGASGFCC